MVRSLACLLVISYLGSAFALPLRHDEQRIPEQPPLPLEPVTPTDRDYQKLQKQWALSQLLTPAVQRWHGKAWAAEAASLTERALDLYCTGTMIRCAMGSVAEDFRKLLAAGADDPLLLTLAAQSYYDESFDWRQARPPLERALSSADLPPAVRVLALRFQIPLLMIQGADYRYVRGDLVDAMIRAVDDDSYRPEDDVVFVRHQIDVMDLVEVTMPSYLTNWQAKISASQWPDWVKLTLQGYGDVELAWLERSDDWAVEVKDAQWEGFARRLKSARDHLTRAWEANPTRPEAAALMITVTMGDSSGYSQELRTWLDRAAKAQLDYQPAYNAMIWALRPRWCGSYESMLSLGLASAATDRFDTGVPNQLFCAAMDIADEINDAFAVFRSPDIRSELAKVSKGYLDAQGLLPQVQHLRQSNAALTAWLAGDVPLALAALKAADQKLHYCTREFMSKMLVHEARLRGEVQAGAGVFGDSIKSLSELAHSTQTDELRRKVEGTDPSTLPSDDARDFLLELKDKLELTDRIAKGDWVKITPRRHLTSWISTGGRWSVDADGSLVAQGDDATWAVLALDLPLEENLELRSEMRFENESGAELSPKGVGYSQLLHWQPSMVGEPENGLHLMIARDFGGHERSMIFRTKMRNASEGSVMTEDWNRFSTRMAEGKVSCMLNGRAVLQPSDLDRLGVTSTDGRIGFTVYRLPVGAKVRIRNIEVRRITAATASVMEAPAPDGPIKSAPHLKSSEGIPWKFIILGVVGVLAVLTMLFVKPQEV